MGIKNCNIAFFVLTHELYADTSGAARKVDGCFKERLCELGGLDTVCDLAASCLCNLQVCGCLFASCIWFSQIFFRGMFCFDYSGESAVERELNMMFCYEETRRGYCEEFAISYFLYSCPEPLDLSWHVNLIMKRWTIVLLWVA
jgi:hypothetical protein